VSDLMRCDWAVILARGESKRMGWPKGLCRRPGDDEPFLVRIVRLYGAAGLPVAVVTTDRLRRLYEPALARDAVQRWIEREPGAGTAASAGAALAALVGTASHLWLHPVASAARAASRQSTRPSGGGTGGVVSGPGRCESARPHVRPPTRSVRRKCQRRPVRPDSPALCSAGRSWGGG